MLGSFYENSWNLGSQTQWIPEPFAYPFSRKTHRQNQNRNQFDFVPKMHLRDNEEPMHWGERPDAVAKIQTNGIPKSSNGHSMYVNGSAADTNVVSIPIPADQEVDMVIETVLAAWILLLQRYRRDSFQQCMFGTGQGGDERIQCVSAGQVDLLDLTTVGDLLAKVQNIRSREIALSQGGTVSLRDGTKEDVRLRLAYSVDSH